MYLKDSSAYIYIYEMQLLYRHLIRVIEVHERKVQCGYYFYTQTIK